MEQTSSAIEASNGILVNGTQANGILVNGILVNGILVNGILVNGTSINGILVNGILVNGAPLDPDQEDDFIEIYEYLVSCALLPEQQATLYDSNGVPRVFEGALGVAPEWLDGPLDRNGSERVSACLAARANALERTVLISLRGCGISATAQEKDIFSTYEGIFWGNLFDDGDPATEPELFACMAQGGGLSGRVCSQSDECGFTLLGDCSSACSDDDGDGTYDRCGYADDSNLIHTWLSLSNRLAFGDSNAIGRDSDGTAYVWGENRYGQVARSPSQRYFDSPEPIARLGHDNAELVIHEHGCARKKSGDLFCWGRNDHGQIGNGTRVEDAPYAHPSPEHIAQDVAQVTIGRGHGCLLETNGQARCWGGNNYGQLGIGEANTSSKSSPQTVQGMESGVLRLSAGSTTGRHTCAIKTDNRLWCWGDNQYGQLGNGKISREYSPIWVETADSGAAFTDVTDVCASKTLTCARKSDGTAWCWGGGSDTPYGSKKPRHYPLDPADPTLAVAPGGLACGTDWACFVATDSTVWCMGENRWGQLGYDTGHAPSGTLERARGLDGVSFVNAARTHTCALRTDSSQWCWGTDPGLADGRPAMLSPELLPTPREIDIDLP